MFSVLITTYNGSKYIINQIESIVNQSYPLDKIYIYDDCSTDNTVEKIEEWILRNNIPNIVISRNKENKGYARNFLEALFKIEDQYVFLSDQDDVWKNDKVEEYKNAINSITIKDIPLLVTSGYSVTNEKLTIIKDCHIFVKGMKLVKLKSFLKDCSYPGMTFCINKNLIKLAKDIYNPKYVAFHDYFLSLLAIGYGKMICLQKRCVLYRQHKNNQIGAAGIKEKSSAHWQKVLEQKKKESETAIFCLPKNTYIKKRYAFINKRIKWFHQKNIILISINIIRYLYFYDLKSYVADLYYCVFIKKEVTR